MPLIVNGNPPPLEGQELLEKVGEPLRQAIYKELELPVEANRQAQIRQAKRNYLYMEGKQYPVREWSSDGRNWDWAPGQSDEKDGKKRKFASCYNIIYADGIKFIAVVGQRPPNIKAVPEDPMMPNQVSLATDANTAGLALHKQWDIRRRMKEIAFYLWSTSAVFLHTRYVADAQRYGTIQYPKYDTRSEVFRPEGMNCSLCGEIALAMACPQCGSPLNPLSYQEEVLVDVAFENGVETYPKGQVELDILTTFEVGTVFGARTLEECDWLSHDTMEPEYALRALYELGDVPLNGSTSDLGSVTDAQQAKEAIESPNGVACFDKAANALHSRKFIRPTFYHALPPNIRTMLQQQYPTGIRVIIVGNKVVKLEHKKMDDYWSVCKTGTGPKISDPPLCSGVISIQDDLNDFVNMGRETILRGIPKTFVDGTLLDPQALKENEALVGEIIRVKMGAGQSIGSLMGQLPVAKLNEQMMPFGDWQRNMSREIDGVQPAIYGGGTPSTTFRGENQRKNQALMQLQPPFEEMINAVCRATENGVKEWAKYGVGRVKVASKDPMVPTRHLQLENLQINGWSMEADESAPVTIAEKQERISGISQENPALAAALGFAHPMNTAEMQRMFGVDGLYTPGAMQLKKALATIQALLQEQGIDDFDPMTGQPVRLPSQMPDPYEFKDAMFMSQVFHAWVLSDCGQEFATLNPAGFENVKLFGGQLDLMATPPMPIGAPGDTSAPPAPEGGGPPPEVPPMDGQLPPIPPMA